MNIVLVRRATCAQMDSVLLGRSIDQPLNLRGEGQARGLARRLLAFSELTIHSSPRRRARHTAGIIASQRESAVTIAPLMDEVDFGSWSGRTFVELAEDPHWRRWNQYRAVTRTPAGDSIRDVQERAMTCFRKLQQSERERTVAIVTHAEVIRSVVLLAMGAPAEDYGRVEISPASLTLLSIQGTQLRLDRLNERAAA